MVIFAMPVVFIIFYSFGGILAQEHVLIRLGVVVFFAALVVKAFDDQIGKSLISTLPKRVWVPIGLLTLIAVSRVIFGEDNYVLTVVRTTMWLALLTLGLTLFSLFKKIPTDDVLKFVLVAVVGSSALYVLLIAGWFAYDGPPTGPLCTNSMPGFKNVRYTAYFSAPALGFAVVMAASKQAQMLLRIATFFVAVCLWMYLEYTGARGAVLAIVAAGLVSSVCLPLRASLRLFIVACLTFCIAIGLIWLIPPAECESFGMVNRLQASVDSDRITTGRAEIWSLCWELIKQRPLFGHGEIRLYNYSDFAVTQPHNFVLQSLLAWGFVGTALILALLGELAIRLLHAARNAPWQARPVLFGVLTIAAYGQISGALYHAFPLLIATVLLAAAAALIKPHSIKSDDVNGW
jgi:O-antigen ligase